MAYSFIDALPDKVLMAYLGSTRQEIKRIMLRLNHHTATMEEMSHFVNTILDERDCYKKAKERGLQVSNWIYEEEQNANQI